MTYLTGIRSFDDEPIKSHKGPKRPIKAHKASEENPMEDRIGFDEPTTTYPDYEETLPDNFDMRMIGLVSPVKGSVTN